MRGYSRHSAPYRACPVLYSVLYVPICTVHTYSHAMFQPILDPTRAIVVVATPAGAMEHACWRLCFAPWQLVSAFRTTVMNHSRFVADVSMSAKQIWGATASSAGRFGAMRSKSPCFLGRGHSRQRAACQDEQRTGFPSNCHDLHPLS